MSELFPKTTMRICAIVVTYHPDFFSLRRQFDSITPQVSAIRVIDNSGTSDVSDWISKETFQHQHVTVHNLYENQGLGAAYNIGIRWAQRHGTSNRFIVFDLTSISSYANGIDMVEWGYNRDRESLPQINLGVIYGEPSALPLFYSLYPGSIHDVTTLKILSPSLRSCHLIRLSSYWTKASTAKKI